MCVFFFLCVWGCSIFSYVLLVSIRHTVFMYSWPSLIPVLLLFSNGIHLDLISSIKHGVILYPKCNCLLSLKIQPSLMSCNIILTVMYIDILCYCMIWFSHCSTKHYY